MTKHPRTDFSTCNDDVPRKIDSGPVGAIGSLRVLPRSVAGAIACRLQPCRRSFWTNDGAICSVVVPRIGTCTMSTFGGRKRASTTLIPAVPVKVHVRFVPAGAHRPPQPPKRESSTGVAVRVIVTPCSGQVTEHASGQSSSYVPGIPGPSAT